MIEQSNSTQEKKYCCEYRFNNQLWAVDLYATSWEEAKQKLKAISQGKVLGELGGELPAQLGWLARFIVWWKNFSTRTHS